MSFAAATSHSVLQPLNQLTPNGPSFANFVNSVYQQTAAGSMKLWQKLPRKTQILLVALAMTTCSFGLSMIVATLAH